MALKLGNESLEEDSVDYVGICDASSMRVSSALSKQRKKSRLLISRATQTNALSLDVIRVAFFACVICALMCSRTT